MPQPFLPAQPPELAVSPERAAPPEPVEPVEPVGRPDPFVDVLSANADYCSRFRLGGLEPRAARGLGLVTCMDSRIEPLDMLGLKPGDAKILRTAGARVTDDVLRSLVLAVYVLGVSRVMVIAHTGCGMTRPSDDAVHELIRETHAVDTRSLDFRTVPDEQAALRRDVVRVRAYPWLPPELPVGGYLYDVASGRVRTVVPPE